MAFLQRFHQHFPLVLKRHTVAVVFGMLVACGGDVFVDSSQPGGGNGGSGGEAVNVSASSGGGGDPSSGSTSSSVATGTSSTSGGGGAGGLWTQQNCFLWDSDAGPCPPKEEASQYMSMCGFSVLSVDEGPFVDNGKCCYTVSGWPNPC